MNRSALVSLALALLLAVPAVAGCNKDQDQTKDDAAPPTASTSAPAGDQKGEDKAGADEGDKKAADKKEDKGGDAAMASFDHSKFDALLKKYVTDDGLVDYKSWKADEASVKELTAYRDSVAKADISKLDDKEKLAFYINAYNAHTINAVLERYPIKSVMDVDGFFKKIEHEVAGEKVTLDTLENKKIREGFGEARIHFVVNCASASCPKILPDALTKDNMEKLMEEATKAYVKQETTYDEKGKKVVTSKIFEWFKGDFDKQEGSVAKFLAKYGPEDKKAFVESAKVETKEYDWALNDKK